MLLRQKKGQAKVWQSAGWQFASNILAMLTGMVQIIVVSRYFEIALFGQLSVALVIMNIVQSIADIGMSNYLVHRQKPGKRLVSAVFWMGVLSSLCLATAIIGIASPLAEIYQAPNLPGYLFLVALSFPLIATSSTCQAGFVAQKRLVQLAQIELTAKFVSFGGFFMFIFSGVSVESLILANLTFLVCKLLVLLYFSDPDYRPSFRLFFLSQPNLPKQQPSELKAALAYGIYQVGSQILNQVRLNIDVLVLGTLISQTSLGWYSLAKQLVSKPVALVNPIVGRIGLSAFAQQQHDIQALKTKVIQALTVNSACLSLIYGCLILLAQPVVNVIYGESNQPAAIYVVPLALFWLLRYLVGAIVGPLVQALARTKVDFYWNLMSVILVSATVFVSARYGAQTLAWCLVGVQLVLILGVYRLFYRPMVQLNWRELFTSIALYPLLVAGAALVVRLLDPWLQTAQPMLNIVIAIVLVGCLFTLLCIALRCPLFTLLTGKK